METILITDDDKVGRDTIQAALERGGYIVEGAACVDEAISAINRKAFDLIVCDYRMPGKTGLDLLNALQFRTPPIPVLMISADADANTESEARRLGAAGVLRKPFRRQALIDSVDRALHFS